MYFEMSTTSLMTGLEPASDKDVSIRDHGLDTWPSHQVCHLASTADDASFHQLEYSQLL